MMEKNTQQSTSIISRLLSKITSILQNSLVNLVIGILITVLFFYFVERKEVDTKYAVSNIELIAAQTSDAPELQLYWADEQITDIYSVKIAFWNSGKQYLNTDGISKSNPVHIVIPKNVRVLFAEVIESSRQNLRFSTAYNQESIHTDGIVIKILDDEAIEQMDGGVVKILFTGKPNSEFYVTGRILGNNKGFEKTTWGGPSWEVLFMLIFLPIQGIFLFNSAWKSSRKSIAFAGGLLFSAILIILPVVTLIYGYQTKYFTFGFPDWIH